MKFSKFALLVAAVCLTGCSSFGPPRGAADADPTSEPTPGAEPLEEIEPAEIGVVRSAQQRNMNPQLEEGERVALAAGQVRFAVDFYHAVRKLPETAGKDIFLSPHSVSIALAMTYAGARGETAAEMREALRFALPRRAAPHRVRLSGSRAREPRRAREGRR